MKIIVDTIPLKPGKLEAYKAFVSEFTGARRNEYIDLLKRYSLKSADVYFNKIADIDFVIVVHTAEDDSRIKLKQFGTSTYPIDKWFIQQLSELHDYTLLNGLSQEATQILAFTV